MTFDPCHQQAFFLHSTAAHSIFLFLGWFGCDVNISDTYSHTVFDFKRLKSCLFPNPMLSLNSSESWLVFTSDWTFNLMKVAEWWHTIKTNIFKFEGQVWDIYNNIFKLSNKNMFMLFMFIYVCMLCFPSLIVSIYIYMKGKLVRTLNWDLLLSFYSFYIAAGIRETWDQGTIRIRLASERWNFLSNCNIWFDI